VWIWHSYVGKQNCDAEVGSSNDYLNSQSNRFVDDVLNFVYVQCYARNNAMLCYAMLRSLCEP
jgi:hypothetical protein